MRTYDILDADGIKLRSEAVDDSIRPTLLHGQEAVLTHIDGDPAIQGEPLILTDAERARLPDLEPIDADLPMEYVVGVSGERPDDAHPGTQIGPLDGAAAVSPVFANAAHAE